MFLVSRGGLSVWLRKGERGGRGGVKAALKAGVGVGEGEGEASVKGVVLLWPGGVGVLLAIFLFLRHCWSWG